MLGKMAFRRPYISRVLRFGKEMIYFLTYHSISRPSPAIPEELGLCVSPERFESHMRHISRFYHPISLKHAEEILVGRASPISNAVAVSFDDGYRDNLTTALPILRKYNVPATIFVITNCAESGNRPWNIQLYFDLYNTRIKAVNLFDNVNKEKISLPLHTVGLKYRAMLWLRPYLKAMKWADVQRVVAELHSQLRSTTASYFSDHLTMLDWQDIGILQESGIIFGSHTVHHMILENEDDDTIIKEVRESRELLEDRLRCPVRSFAYPGNAGKGFSERTMSLIGDAGFQSCYLFSTGSGFNSIGCDLLRLNRSEVLGSVHDLSREISGLMEELRHAKRRLLS
jgi:peptidoglycan/xylan/chitin deacetylase (PgdA/CDA1 family)